MDIALVVVAALGIISLLLTAGFQGCAHWKLTRRNRRDSFTPPVSILKPLKGVDDRLYENLCSLARQDYPGFEIVFGAAESDDPALEVARQVARDFPEVDIRVIVSAHRIGMNPKVNNLVNLAAVAQHEYVLISDSNVEVDPGYLRAITAEFADPDVGLVANLLAGVGERSLGSELENLHLNTWVATAVAAADVLDRPIVVGKSMLFRLSDLERVGGLWGVRDVLAEDFVLGRRFRAAGMKVITSEHVVRTINVDWSLSQFLARHLRWSQLRRRLGAVTYLGELLINPTPFFAAVAVLGFVGFSALGIGSLAWASLGVAGIVTKAALDVALTHRLRGRAPSLVAVGWLPLKDLMIAVLWAVAAVRRTVVWRGNRMWIGAGTVLSPMPSAADELDLAGLPPLEPSVEDAAGTNS